MEGNAEAKYWLARKRLRAEFGLTAAEADVEPYEEVMVYLKIWEFENKRHDRDEKLAQFRAKHGQS